MLESENNDKTSQGEPKKYPVFGLRVISQDKKSFCTYDIETEKYFDFSTKSIYYNGQDLNKKILLGNYSNIVETYIINLMLQYSLETGCFIFQMPTVKEVDALHAVADVFACPHNTPAYIQEMISDGMRSYCD